MTNTWVSYIDRSYEQIKSALISKLKVKLPEITDHSENNIFISLISMWSGISEMLNYYIDNVAREMFTNTARQIKSLILLANQFDCRLRGIIPATGKITITNNNNTTFTILKGDIFVDQNGNEFVCKNTITCQSNEASVIVDVEQYKIETSTIGVTNGIALQTIALNKAIYHKDVSLLIDNVTWTQVDSLALSNYLDTHFIVDLDENYQTVIKFGDGINGKIPELGFDILATYKVSIGKLANGLSGQLTKKDDLTFTNTITINYIREGYNVPNLLEIKSSINTWISSLNRLVIKNDFIKAIENLDGVAKIGISYNLGSDLILYIVPDNGNLTPELLNRITNFVELNKIISIPVVYTQASIIDIKLSVNVSKRLNVDDSIVSADIFNQLVNLFEPTSQDIQGKLVIGDLYEYIEKSTYVKNSEIILLEAKPFARQLNTSNILNFSINLKDFVNNNIKYKVQISFGNKYQLFKDNLFIGEFNIGQLYSFTEIDLTVLSGSYDVGDTFEFYIYRKNTSISLNEPGVFRLTQSNLIINYI